MRSQWPKQLYTVDFILPISQLQFNSHYKYTVHVLNSTLNQHFYFRLVQIFYFIIMARKQSKKGHIATDIFSFFFSFFCFFFSFFLTLGFSAISRKPLEIKLPN